MISPVHLSLLAANTAANYLLLSFVFMHIEGSSESAPLLVTASKRMLDILQNLNVPSGE